MLVLYEQGGFLSVTNTRRIKRSSIRVKDKMEALLANVQSDLLKNLAANLYQMMRMTMILVLYKKSLRPVPTRSSTTAGKQAIFNNIVRPNKLVSLRFS